MAAGPPSIEDGGVAANLAGPDATVASNAMVAAVVALCDKAAACLSGDAAPHLEVVRSRLLEPLRLAVAGRVKAGKSTLVNALLGQRVAPTEVSECTRVVTWFRYGPAERAELRLRDGTRRSLEFGPDGLLPTELGVPVGEAAAIDVWLSNRTLGELVVIDTPGLASTTADTSQRTEQLLGVDQDSSSAIAEAEAVVFVMNQSVHADEAQVLGAFDGLAGGATRSRASALGILTKADLVGTDLDDPLAVAGSLAQRQAALLADRVIDVVPVIGLLAETIRAGSFTEQLAAQLAALATQVGDRSLLLASTRRFLSTEGPVSAPDRQRLLDRLGLFGIERALVAIDNRVTGAAALSRHIMALSGIDAVIDVIDRRLRAPAPVLKADRAVRDLEHLGTELGGADGGWLRDEVERLRKDSVMHRRAVLDVEDALASGGVVFPPEVEVEALRLVSDGPAATRLGLEPTAEPAELASAALAAAQRWQARANRAVAPETSHVAAIVARSAHLLHRSIRGDAS